MVVVARATRHPVGPAARHELAGTAAGAPLRCQVKLRAREQPRPARFARRGGAAGCGWTPPALPAPGQACVFYDGTRVLGGGFIRREAAAWLTRPGAAAISPASSGSDGGVAQR